MEKGRQPVEAKEKERQLVEAKEWKRRLSVVKDEQDQEQVPLPTGFVLSGSRKPRR